jgi:ribosomal protein L5
VTAVYERVFPEDAKAKIWRISKIFYREKEAPQDWYAHPLIATAYAGYLNPKLEIEIAEIWLRYRAGDPTLADEILQNATPAANEWAGARAISRAVRNDFTEKLREHEVVGSGYALCTDAVYKQLLGGPAKKIRDQRGLPQKGNVRDALSKNELSFIMAAESLATERIADEDRRGNDQCMEATSRSASFIREAIDRDRLDRQKRIP